MHNFLNTQILYIECAKITLIYHFEVHFQFRDFVRRTEPCEHLLNEIIDQLDCSYCEKNKL